MRWNLIKEGLGEHYTKHVFLKVKNIFSKDLSHKNCTWLVSVNTMGESRTLGIPSIIIVNIDG